MAQTAAHLAVRRQPSVAVEQDAAEQDAAGDALPPPRLSGRNGYSLFVSSMKVLLPALAAGLVLLVVAWPQLIPDVSRSGIDFQKIARDQAKTLNMLNARYSGVDENNQPFNIAADLATQAPENENLIELQHPKADIRTIEGDLVALSARLGHYHRADEKLDLSGKVHLTHDEGFDVVTETATIDLNEGSAAGSSAVSGQGPTGTLQSEGFRLSDRGQVILFTGKSRLLMYPGGQSDQPQDDAGSPAPELLQ